MDPGGADLLLSSQTASETALRDSEPTWGDKYYYALRTTNSEGEQAWSNEVIAALPNASWEPGDLSTGPLAEMDFAYIPMGSFQMGASEWDPDAKDDEYPVHTVTFGYYFEMMTTEVTREMFEEVMGYDPSWNTELSADCPVENMYDWEIEAFADSLNAMDPYYEYRLPSEAEWEYACRAGSTTRCYWGDEYDTDPHIDEYAWYKDNTSPGHDPRPVGLLLPNAWGLYDMMGNISECCLDNYFEDYVGAPDDGSPRYSYVGDYIVTRGGDSWSWAHGMGVEMPELRSSAKNLRYSDLHAVDTGFRLVRTPR